MQEFKVNECITLKLEDGITNIYVNEELFDQCKFLLLNIPVDKISSFDEIESIDEAAEKLDHSMEPWDEFQQHKAPPIPPEVEFWGHCSNIQVWCENNYNTSLIHRNLAFYLLKKLNDAGDETAKYVFKGEIAKRLESGFPPVVIFIVEEGYIEYLPKEYIENFLKNKQFLEILIEKKGEKPNFEYFIKKYIDSLDKSELNISLIELIKIYKEIYNLDYDHEKDEFLDFNCTIFLWNNLKNKIKINKRRKSAVIKELFQIFLDNNEYKFALNNAKINEDIILPLIKEGLKENSLINKVFFNEVDKILLKDSKLYALINMINCVLKFSEETRFRNSIIKIILKIFERENLSPFSNIMRIKSLKYLKRDELLMFLEDTKLKLVDKILGPLSHELDYDSYEWTFNELEEYNYYEFIQLVSDLFGRVQPYPLSNEIRTFLEKFKQ